MKHYLLGDHYRFFRINDYNIGAVNRFYPTQNWFYLGNNEGVTGHVMFHYGMLTDPNAKLDFWRTEYRNKAQEDKVLWINKIYRNYDLSDEKTWIEKNNTMFGVRSPWFSDSFTPKEDGTLFRYTKKEHPKLIEESGLTEVEDFRKKYNFASEDV